MEFVTVDTRTRKEKIHDFFEESKRKVKETAQTAWEHREIVVPGVVGILATACKLSSNATRRKEIHEAEIRRERTFYDRSAGCYWEAKRRLAKNEMLEITERKRNGEDYGHILDDMGLLRGTR